MDKEIFIIHTKNSSIESIFFDRVSFLLNKYNISIWNYGDWDWEQEIENTRYSSSGRQVDMRKFLSGNPRPFKRIEYDEEVDYEKLKYIQECS